MINNSNDSKDIVAKVHAWKQFLNKMNFPENMPDYSSQSYWDSRYQMEQNQHYEWYVDYFQLKPYFEQFLSPNMDILQLGSGNSNILDMLYKSGFKKLTGSDFSWNIINYRKNQQRYLKRGIKWQILQITKQWPLKQVNCIFEKAVLDCLPLDSIQKSLELIHKSLKPGGIFFHVSNTRPEKRIKLLSGWDIKVYELKKIMIPMFQQIDRNAAYYLYVCNKFFICGFVGDMRVKLIKNEVFFAMKKLQ